MCNCEKSPATKAFAAKAVAEGAIFDPFIGLEPRCYTTDTVFVPASEEILASLATRVSRVLDDLFRLHENRLPITDRVMMAIQDDLDGAIFELAAIGERRLCPDCGYEYGKNPSCCGGY